MRGKSQGYIVDRNCDKTRNIGLRTRELESLYTRWTDFILGFTNVENFVRTYHEGGVLLIRHAIAFAKM